MKINLVLKALNHPIRRDIIARLREGPLSAGDLAAFYDVSKPTMSTHYATLKDADLIRGEKDGVTIFYHLNATVAEDALSSLMALLGTGETGQAVAPSLNKETSS
ncbi:metalloregulator ArsR/SmtB family transcription factor [Algimonas porphyrae]|uniref:Transcriptional regulator n=1 Tax=Algimonas porphyrae TaxID=1128113 RepID=A0ABQ5V1B7_9PROT|nr:metalloregulator ArsR/SmtB family transcription factor [Algimonas porphyrae]GLQ20588.1 transcriptional regulator [Algimonas porphyrae]